MITTSHYPYLQDTAKVRYKVTLRLQTVVSKSVLHFFFYIWSIYFYIILTQYRNMISGEKHEINVSGTWINVSRWKKWEWGVFEYVDWSILYAENMFFVCFFFVVGLFCFCCFLFYSRTLLFCWLFTWLSTKGNFIIYRQHEAVQVHMHKRLHI